VVHFICLSITFLVLFISPANAQQAEEQQLDDQAKDFLSKGMLDSAVLKFTQRALHLKKNDRLAEYISSIVEIADLYVQNEDYLKSRSYLDRIDPDSINHNNPEVRTSLIEWYLYQGYVSEKVGDYLSAKHYYEQVHLRLVRSEDEQVLELGRYLYQPLGNIYTRLGEHEKAILFLEKFRELSLLSRDQNASAEAYSDLSIVYQSLGQSQQAIAIYEEALKLPGLSNKSKGLILSNLGSSLLSVGRMAEALTCSKQALSFFTTVNEKELSNQNKNAYQAWTYGVIAKVCFEQDDHIRALENIDRALKYSELAFGNSVSREVAKLYVLKGSILLKNHQTQEALQNFQLALTFLFNTYKDTDTENNPDESMLFAENTIIEALEGKAQAYYQHYLRVKEVPLLEKALKAYQLTFEVEDKIAEEYDFHRSKLLLLGERNERSHIAMDICYTLYQTTQDDQYIEIAFEIMERNKARVLLESQSEVRARKAVMISKSLLQKQLEHKQSVAYFQKALMTGQDDARKDSVAKESLFRAQKELAGINQQLAIEYPDYYRLVAQQMKLISVKQVQDSLIHSGQALIEFFFSNEFLYAVTVEKENIDFRQIRTSDEFFATTNRYLDLLRKPSTDPIVLAELYQISFEIYQHLLKPLISDRFTKYSIIIPDGVLMYLPFETLVTTKPSPSEDVIFLLSETATSYSFSASALYQSMLLNEMNSSAKNFLGFAPGFINSKAFQPLKYSQDEVEGIADLLDGRVYKNDRALKRTFINEAGQYQILHLSTHAAVERNSPLYSWVAFHDGMMQEEDSFKLFLSEIYNLQLQADLVVLSACETGTGYLSQGEGVMSLARGFAFAGCTSTLMTLWQVSDNATSRINQAFYNYLLKGWKKDDALRQAKLDYLASDDIDKVGKHPYFWSSLVVMGDMRPIELPRQRNLFWMVAIATAGLIALVLAIKKRRRNTPPS
jgi:CHAT domain-containing protein